MKTPSDELTPKEQAAVRALVAVLKAFPPTLCLFLDDGRLSPLDGPNLKIYKRTGPGAGVNVFSLRKKSLSL